MPNLKLRLIILTALSLAIPGFYEAHAIGINGLIAKYNFDFAESINVTNFDDFMIDSDFNGLNDILILELMINNILGLGNYILAVDLTDEHAIANESSKILVNGMNKINISFDSSLLSKNKFNYSVRIYNSGYDLKYRKDNIETNEYSDYEEGFKILDIADKKIQNSLSFNLTVNTTKNGSYEFSIFLKYDDSIILAKTNSTLSDNINYVSIIFDNETVKRTHYTGRFNISSIAIGKKSIKISKETDYYDYGDFAATSYIKQISDIFDVGNLLINFSLNIKDKSDYRVEFSIYDLFDNIIGVINNSFSLSNGIQTAPVVFDGAVIYDKKLNGPYAIKNIKLLKNNEVIDYTDSYITGYYTFDSFSKPSLPDLQSKIEVSDGYHYGINNVSVNITLSNIGIKSAFNIFVEIFDNNTLSKRGQLAVINSSGIKKYIFEFVNISDFEITAIADINNFVEELNESNNAARKEIKLNKNPFLYDIGNITINETEKITINLTAIDPNDDELNYIINNSNFKNIDNNSNYFEWHTTTMDSGNYAFEAAVTDGWLNDSGLFYVNVMDMPSIDGDNDGINDSVDAVLGDIKDVNTSTINTTIVIGNFSDLSRIFNETLKVKIKDNNITVVEFEFDFSNDKLNLGNITMDKQSNESFGFFIIKGLKLPEGMTKSLYFDKINDNNGVCIKDYETTNISDSESCNGQDEFKVECSGALQEGYSCIYNDTIGKYRVSGLRHSAVSQIDILQQSSGGSSGGGGGGGVSGIKTIKAASSPETEGSPVIIAKCIPDWKCGGWSECSDGLKSRNCYDAKGCEKEKGEQKECSINVKEEKQEIESKKIEYYEDQIFRTGLIDGFGAITGYSAGKFEIKKETKITLFVALALIAAYLLFTGKFSKFSKKRKLFMFILLISAIRLSSGFYDDRNTGALGGTGYFPVDTYNFSTIFGMDFYPLIKDFDNDGISEIILFSDGYIRAFNYRLELLNEKYVGDLLGQPNLYQDIIVFNSRQKNNPSDYFFAFAYNGTFNQEFNLTVDNAEFGGIRCADSICVFKSKMNNVNIVDMSSKSIESFSVSDNNDSRYTVPSIGDVDNDGNLEAVFWFNNNSGNKQGILVFDLGDKKTDWITENVFEPYATAFFLRGNPVLVDLDNDNKLEIAVSMLYNDYNTGTLGRDTFTELFVYSSNGRRLFSVCEERASGVGCNDGFSGTAVWDGTNPFVLDTNEDNVDEICFIKDKKVIDHFKGMAVDCYNYSGNLMYEAELVPYSETIRSAILADINNDGKKEIITPVGIYLLNGTLIYPFDSGFYFQVPYDLDGNSRLDLLLTKNGLTKALVDDTGTFRVENVQINPGYPSLEDPISCSWKVIGSKKTIPVKVSWFQNNGVFTTEIVDCVNETLCSSSGIHTSALRENELWECSVKALDGGLEKSDTALILGRKHEWNEFGKNRISYGISPGTGILPNYFFYKSFGSDYMPMVDDMDIDLDNEIVLFFNNSLFILNETLGVMAGKKVGNLAGQFDIADIDDDKYIEIVAVLRNENMDNFTVMHFNGTEIEIEKSFDVTSQNGLQHIRCVDFDNDNITECIYRDYNGIVHSYTINSSGESDDELNINISDGIGGSDVNIVPGFVDFDNDNDLDGLFWFDDNFVVIDSGKNILLNVDVGTLYSFDKKKTLYGAKFVDLDRIGGYEIAVAYRNDFAKYEMRITNINLSLFNSRGDAIFSNAINFFTSNCNKRGKSCIGYGSELMVMDYDRDGFDDLGIYLQGFDSSLFGTYIRFYDRIGREIASSKAEFLETEDINSVSMADIDNDNALEIMLGKRIYNLDGTVAYNFSDKFEHAIPVDIDDNGVLDMLLSSGKTTELLLDFAGGIDFFVEEPDISFKPLNNTRSIVTINAHSSRNYDLISAMVVNTESADSIFGAVPANGNMTAVLKLNNYDKVLVNVDYENKVIESNEDNNFAFREFLELPYVYVESTGIGSSVILDYIKNNLVSGYHTDKKSEADVLVYVGKDNSYNVVNNVRTKHLGFGYERTGSISYYDETGNYPFNGLVGGFVDAFGRINIMVVGNEIEGLVAAVKKLVEMQSILFNIDGSRAFFIDDADAVKLYDYMHNAANEDKYYKNNKEFMLIVKNSLYGTMFTSEDKTVTTADGITLRLRNVKADFSQTYLDYLNSTGVPVGMPVVLSRGIHSNLSTWEVLAGELANEGRDAWLIEITGGPGQDCDTCPNYNFSDLTDNYWPMLINGVLDFTGAERLQYAGHSNGCRTALESLRLNRISPNKVDTFIGVGCPGAFNYDSPGKLVFNTFGDEMIEMLSNKTHVSADEIGRSAKGLCSKYFNFLSPLDRSNCYLFSSGYSGNGKMSFNLAKNYNEWINNITDLQPGQNLTFDYFKMFYGTTGVFETIATGQSDGLVAKGDILEISNGINANIKKDEPENTYRIVGMMHTSENPKKSLPDNQRTKKKIKKFLNRQN